MSKIVLITGGTSGIGLCTAKCLCEKGCTVYTLSRRDALIPNITHLKGDVTCRLDVERAVEQIMHEHGRIDIVVNAAGFGISGAVEFTDTEDARKLFDVNFFGMVNVNRAVLPIMHQQKSGRIVNISSVASPIAIPFQTYYSASKAAIDAYTMALANEVRPYGITVCSVLPGDIATGFTAARQKAHVGDDAYGGRIERSVSRMERDEMHGMRPEIAGRVIAGISLKSCRKPKYSIGLWYKLFTVLAKILPAQFLNWIVSMLYAR